MSKKTRYLLIFFCFLCFAIASPVIVLYVKGIAFDVKSGEFYKTGILGISAMPKKVTISLNGKISRVGEGNIRFLKPKEYLVEISKNDYQTWSKRLNVSAGQVTWTNPGNNKINLFYRQPINLFAVKGVTSFIQINDKVFYTENGFLVEQNINQTVEKFTHELPEGHKEYTIAYKVNAADLLILKTTDQKKPLLFYNLDSKSFIRDTNSLSLNSEIKFYNNGLVYSLSEGKIYEIDLQKNIKKPLLENVTECLFTGTNFYFLRNDQQGLSLFTSPMPGNPESKISSGLPAAEQKQIFADFQNHIFIKLDKSLYRIAAKPELVAENISDLNFDDKHSGFAFVTGPEFFWLDSSSPEPKFIHRSSLPLKLPYFLPEINYAFINKDNRLSALELDLRDKQNEFPLFQASEIKNYALSEDGKHLVILNGTSLNILEIR